MYAKNDSKWVLFVSILLGALLILAIVLEVTSQDFFFKDWPVQDQAMVMVETPQGIEPILLIVVCNPDPKGKIQKVKIVASQQGVLWYVYFDGLDACHWQYNGKEFVRNKDEEAKCADCHKERKKISL